MLVVAVAACGSDDSPTSVGLAPSTTLAIPLPDEPPPAASPLLGLSAELSGQFEELTWVGAPLGDDRLFVIEKRGVVKVRIDGDWSTYLDLSGLVSSDGPELGMVGLAFHPNFADNGRFFVYYTNVAEDSRVVEFAETRFRTAPDPTPPKIILAVDQPQEWHNGGTLHFGPDGYLWLSLGDGGGISDKYENGQDSNTLLGTLLRIDVNDGEPYAIPPGNPFVDGGGAPEVWAYGLRNPFRFFINPIDRLVYIADVGQEKWEEINLVELSEPGRNFGWPITEGTECYVHILLDPRPASVPCSMDGLTGPDLAYPHGPACSIIGGPVYLGQEIPELYGHYLYADWCAGWLRSIKVEGGVIVDRMDWSEDLGALGQITSVGTDGSGEPYIVTGEGQLYRVVPRR
ncbi:MAG: PQQ-dependent sugar dehydrogenase [Acidimicrobiia bacterium]